MVIPAERDNAEAVRVMTYNVMIAGSDDNMPEFIDTRRHELFQTVVNNVPDLIGFQEASTMVSNSDGVTQQDALGQLFDGTQYQYLTWEVQGGNIMSVIAVNTDRFSPVANGTHPMDLVDDIGETAWERYHDLHGTFHAQGGFVHRMSSERHANWVVADDLTTDKRVLLINTHYETFIGNNNLGAEFDDDFAEFTSVVNASFGYWSRTVAALAATLRAEHGADGVVILGDLETIDVNLPGMLELTDAGYTEAWWYMNPAGAGVFRPVQGIDNVFLNLADFDIVAAAYDEADYTDDASDHKPLYADLSWK